MNRKWDITRFFFLNFPLEITLFLFIIPAMVFSRILLPFFIMYLFFIMSIVILSYLLFTKTKHSFYKFLTLDITHTLFLAPVIFVLIAGIGGVSQAVVEGVAGNVFYRYTLYAIHTLYVLLFAQILIIPWSLFCNYLLKKSINTKIIKVVFLSSFSAIIAYILLISGCRVLFMRSSKPNAKYMYQYYFSTPIDKIEKLRSGGMAWLDNPVCLRFQSKESIFLKDQNLYSPANISAPRRFFLREYPNDKHILNDTTNLECFSYIKKEETYARTYWLLHNKRTGHYYFLIE